jgi:hypothetical protein
MQNKESLTTLNVGGKLFTTLTSTLVSKNSFFKVLLNHISQDSVPILRDSQGNPFIDRNSTCFYYILDYLSLGKDAILPHDRDMCMLLEREAQFYGLDDLIPRLKYRTRHASNFKIKHCYEHGDDIKLHFQFYLDLDGVDTMFHFVRCKRYSFFNQEYYWYKAKLCIQDKKYRIDTEELAKHVLPKESQEHIGKWKYKILNYVCNYVQVKGIF